MDFEQSIHEFADCGKCSYIDAWYSWSIHIKYECNSAKEDAYHHQITLLDHAMTLIINEASFHRSLLCFWALECVMQSPQYRTKRLNKRVFTHITITVIIRFPNSMIKSYQFDLIFWYIKTRVEMVARFAEFKNASQIVAWQAITQRSRWIKF